jgi:citrate lyase subunit beta/citryl-CoA lyase
VTAERGTAGLGAGVAVPRARRSLLFVPGSTPERIATAAGSAADGVILDLEDAVPAGEKARAREWVVATLKRIDFGGRERIVRVNAVGTDAGRADLAAIVPAAPDALLLPKVERPDELAQLDQDVTRLEGEAGLPRGALRLHLLIETVAGVAHARALARVSARASALMFGAADFTRETRGRLVPGRAPELHALSELLLAARLAGLDAIDTPYFELADAPGLEAHARFAADLGYDGKAAIHPGQIEVVNRVFTPTPEAVAEALRVLAAYGDAEARGMGAVSLDGRFIDAAHVTMARQALARAQGGKQP